MDYKNVYRSIIETAQARTETKVRTERHHIIPVSLGGNNSAENLVDLTLREHFVCHLLLAKIYGGPMLRAAYMMSTRRLYNSREYSWLRERHINENMLGDKNPSRRIPCTDYKRKTCGEKSKGRKWLNNGVDSCMAKGEQIQTLLDSGWVMGRLMTESLIAGVSNGGKISGGHNRGIPCSKEQAAAISKKLKGNIPWNKGRKGRSKNSTESMQ